MKRAGIFFSTLLLVITLLFQTGENIYADEDAGYHYQSIDIQVDVNDRREFKVIETLHVFYETSKHGIIRTIPESSSVENYWISDIQVEGAPYSVEDYYDGKEIRIGDADKTIKGEATYILSYTLNFYQDYDESADYIYLNLIGDDFDTYIEKLTATITYPQEAIFESCTVTEGEYGSRNNDKISVKQLDNTLYFESISKIRSYEPVTVQIRLNQGAFAQAPEYSYPYIIKEKEINVEVTSEQDFIVAQRIIINANNTYTYYPLDLDMYAFDYRSDVEIQDFSGTIDGKQIDSKYSVSMNNPGEHEILLHYVLHPKQIQHGDLSFELQDDYTDTQVEKLYFTIKLPQFYSYGVTFNRYNDALDKNRFTVSVNENEFVFESQSTLQAKEEAIIDIYVNQADYYRPVPFMILFITMASGVFFLFVCYLKWGKYRNEKLIEPISFYPPDLINSAEAGYLIDNHLSDEDITSLIFQWAHYGALRIEEVAGTITFVKLTSLPMGCPSYEKYLFNSMFGYGSDDRVTEEDLKYYFYEDIERARKAILEKYKKSILLYEPSVEKIKTICIAVAAILLFLTMFFIISSGVSSGFEAIFTLISMLPFMCMLIMVLVLKKVILSIGNALMKLVMVFTIGVPCLLCFMVSCIFIEVYIGYFVLNCIICALTILVCLSMKKRTKEGTRILNELRGFRKFIKTAEKAQLEMLLEKDPEYYYEVLPYAQTLKVTKLWQNKFDGIAMQPPTWYISNTPYSYHEFNTIYRSIHRSMKSSAVRPASSESSDNDSGSGSGFSGGGSGFSGGGYSGGGSGGGGSRSW